jgi:hypothetical protein
MTSETGDLSRQTAQAFAVRWTDVLQNSTSFAQLYKLNNSAIISSGVFRSLVTFCVPSGTDVEAAIQKPQVTECNVVSILFCSYFYTSGDCKPLYVFQYPYLGLLKYPVILWAGIAQSV